MKEQQKVDEPLMSAYDFVTSINHVDKTILEIMDLYLQYHLQRQAEFIAERAMVEADPDEGKSLTKKEFNIENAKNYIVYVNKESILSASKEYVELNIKR